MTNKGMPKSKTTKNQNQNGFQIFLAKNPKIKILQITSNQKAKVNLKRRDKSVLVQIKRIKKKISL